MPGLISCLRAGLLITVAATVFTAAAPARAAPIKTDIVFIVDVSSSLTTKVANLASGLTTMTQRFDALNVDAQYGLVTYLDNDAMPRLNQDLTGQTGITNAFGNILPFVPTVGRTNGTSENGEHALAFALNGIADFKDSSNNSLGPQTEFVSYRDDAIKNLVIITDEPFNQGAHIDLTTGGTTAVTGLDTVGQLQLASGATIDLRRPIFGGLQDLIDASGPTLINGIVELPPPGFCAPSAGQTVISGVYPEYCTNPTFGLDTLVTGNGGNFFDLDVLNSTDPLVIDEFVTQFANTKFQELTDICSADPTAPGCGSAVTVSEPATLGLVGFGLAGFVLVARRRRTH